MWQLVEESHHHPCLPPLPHLESYHPAERADCGSSCPRGSLELTWHDIKGRIWCWFVSERDFEPLHSLFCHDDQNLKISSLSFSLWQNWSGMKCQFKLFRMAMALVCSKFPTIIKPNITADVVYQSRWFLFSNQLCESVWKWANAVLSSSLPLPTVSVEFGRAVWLRFYPPAFPPCPNPSFVAHLGGVLVGLTLGVVVLQNYEQRLQQQTLFWIFFCVYTLFVLCAVFWNIFAYSLLDVRLPPPPWITCCGEGKDITSPLLLILGILDCLARPENCSRCSA